jgi:hypothetical protein
MTHIILALAAALLMSLGAPANAADTTIGSVTRVQGEATWMSGHSPEALVTGAPVFSNQKVSTGDAARLELTFLDGTQLTIGEHASMILDTFVYDPAKGDGKLGMTVKGAFRFVSGKISQQPNKQVAVTTPVATIGIRGTEFWGGPIDGHVLAVYLIDGAVTVTNAKGERVLDAPGEGTDVTEPGALPTAVVIWPQDKIDRALATVTFR